MFNFSIIRKHNSDGKRLSNTFKKIKKDKYTYLYHNLFVIRIMSWSDIYLHTKTFLLLHLLTRLQSLF